MNHGDNDNDNDDSVASSRDQKQQQEERPPLTPSWTSHPVFYYAVVARVVLSCRLLLPPDVATYLYDSPTSSALCSLVANPWWTFEHLHEIAKDQAWSSTTGNTPWTNAGGIPPLLVTTWQTLMGTVLSNDNNNKDAILLRLMLTSPLSQVNHNNDVYRR